MYLQVYTYFSFGYLTLAIQLAHSFPAVLLKHICKPNGLSASWLKNQIKTASFGLVTLAKKIFNQHVTRGSMGILILISLCDIMKS